jgi:hypothetical protein
LPSESSDAKASLSKAAKGEAFSFHQLLQAQMSGSKGTTGRGRGKFT